MNVSISQYNNVEYMGDLVYIGVDDTGRLWIFVHNGVSVTNEICLEDETLGNLIVAVRKFGYKDVIRGPGPRREKEEGE